jgi:cytoskeletal protein CcmA (bactofilin family)
MMKRRDEINAFLGKDTEFEGKLSFSGTVRIDGHFKGEILSDGTLIVGDDAVIESEIQVSQLVVCGEVRGNLVAAEKIEIHPPGKVFGNIQAPAVVMDEGVVFEGSCRMKEVKKSEDGKPLPAP